MKEGLEHVQDLIAVHNQNVSALIQNFKRKVKKTLALGQILWYYSQRDIRAVLCLLFCCVSSGTDALGTNVYEGRRHIP